MKIENDRHPYAGVQRRLQDYDPNLWLVFSPKLQRWLVVLEDRGSSHEPHYAIRGLPGCCGERSHFQVATILWTPKGDYLNPQEVASQLVDAVHQSDQRCIPLLQRLAAVDKRDEDRKETAKRKHGEMVRELAREAFDTAGVGKVMGTSAGVVNYAKPQWSSDRPATRKGILASHGLTPAEA